MKNLTEEERKNLKLQHHESQDQIMAEQLLKRLNQQLQTTQERISKLIDMHIDGKIDAQIYQLKLQEYKQEQQRLTLEIKSYDSNGKAELVAIREVLTLAQEAKELFISSSFDEKQQLLKFFCSNLQLNHEKLDVVLREPFNLMGKKPDQHIWRG